MGSRKQTLIRLHSIIKRLYIDKDYDLFYRLSLLDDFKLSAEIVEFSNMRQIKRRTSYFIIMCVLSLVVPIAIPV